MATAVPPSQIALPPAALEPLYERTSVHRIDRPSLSYWQDAWRRLKANRRAIFSLWLVVALLGFTLFGPLVWRIDPSAQDLLQVSRPPGAERAAIIVPPYAPWAEPEQSAAPAEVPPVVALPAAAQPAVLELAGPATTQQVRLVWSPLPGAAGYRVYRNIIEPAAGEALGLPLGTVGADEATRWEDRLDLRPGAAYYSIVGLDPEGAELAERRTLRVEVASAITLAEARERGLIDPDAQVRPGDRVELAFHPLGTDYLGRDMLARLMQGARVSLFIGIVAPLLFVLLGVAYGSIAGFVGGRTDQAIMRFADFVIALPFLLFMILFKIAFGIGPGESGIVPMIVALVVLSWPGTARLVRGQVLQVREEAYVGAARLLGGPTRYLVLRHMIPNTLGVILVTLTFAIPSAIFTEAFLSFIGLGVAPPTASWGSMSNDGIKTMLSHPHELLFPALMISITVLAFNLLGDGLRDALDAKMRSRE
jgi:oligopeptide transport system permease protein